MQFFYGLGTRLFYDKIMKKNYNTIYAVFTCANLFLFT